MKDHPDKMTSQAIPITFTDADEESWAVRQAKGDMTLFEPLYEKYHDRIFRFIAARVDDLDDAADLCSAAFLKAMQGLARYEDRGLPFGAWLFRIAVNEVNQFYRRKKGQRLVTLDIESVRDISETSEYASREQALKMMEDAIQDLDLKDIELIRMKFYEKKPYEEIAVILGQTVTNLKVRVHRIKARIRDKVQQTNLE